ncbi:MAG: HAMP domain-containing histidine kinase [Planctomycetes bacterium]|nr:HAMP domain-containing histidine kinase [Planctomycetota bacterium]
MRLTIGKKYSIAMAIMITLVVASALAAIISMFIVQKSVHSIVTKFSPLVIACNEMSEHKSLARFALRDYLMEEYPEKLDEIEKQFKQYLAAHDALEKKICDAIDNLPLDNQQMKAIWEKAMSTVMPDFDEVAGKAIETHNKMLDARAKRIALMETHEDHGARLHDLLVDYQDKNSGNEIINRSLMKLKNFHLHSIVSDEEYITKGMLLISKQRLAIRNEFLKHTDIFTEQLEILRAAAENKDCKEFVNEISVISIVFIFSATGKNQLFEMFDKELDFRQKEKLLVTAVGKLGNADSEMASKLMFLASEKLNKAGFVARQKAGNILSVLVALYLLAFIVSWIVTASISKQIVRPVVALSEASKLIANGDLTKKIEATSSDEIGDLCRSFETMRVELHREVSVRKKAEKQREKLLEILEEKNRELQNVVYVASHDLRSPLVTINGFSEELAILCGEIERILESENIDEDVKKKIIPLLKEGIPEDLRFITAGAEKMQVLIGGLLQISRAGTAEVEMASLDMNDMLECICEAMQYDLSSKDISIKLRDLPSCFGDAGMINQVFSNLLDNAVKYRKSNGDDKIVVSGWVENGSSVYCVEDNGVGISASNQSKIFEVFHRLDPQGPVSGEGLGLTIISRILDRHSGKIWVESEPGNGSRFFVSIPTSA